MNSSPRRRAVLEMDASEFKRLGHVLVDRIAEHLEWIGNRDNPVTPAESPKAIRKLLGSKSLPLTGASAEELLRESASLLFDHSLFNGHPKFWGYVSSSPAPIGILGDLLASAVNPNVGAFALSPVATELERQTVQWIAEMIGYPTPCGGILVSGGNMANFVCFLAARKAKIPWDVRSNGMASPEGKPLRIYCSGETHTWIHKAADLFGLGKNAIVWIPIDSHFRMDLKTLRTQIETDLKNGFVPLMIVGAAGTVGTGAVDPLEHIGELCREFNLWFHVDGAYGGFAAALPEASQDLKALRFADSVAIDPHKWLYAPLEAGCALVRNPQVLGDAFSYHPTYYRFDDHAEEEVTNFYELGMQNSRGFRALKVWLALRQAGKEGYVSMIREDCRLAEHLYHSFSRYPELEPLTHSLSITTFRYVPADMRGGKPGDEEYLNKLNTEILSRLQNSGKAYPSNALVNEKYAIRVCIVNFRSSMEDVEALPPMVVSLGREIDREMRQAKNS